jgi:hypothetical protein
MKSERFWKLLAISVVLLVAAGVAAAVNLTSLDSDERMAASPGHVDKHPKMSTEVAAKIPPSGIAPPAELMTVNIYLNTNKTEDLEELQDHTAEILLIKGSRMVAKIYTREIVDIADLPFVSYMDTPLKAQLFSDAAVGKGVKCINADKQHNLGTKGKGVKVAIVDFGFANYTICQEEGKLPQNITVMSFRADGDITGGGEVHGTACAEIVHAVAPDAELYLINYDGYSYQLEGVVDYLIMEEVDIISHSAGGTAGLFDGTDYICGVIDDAWHKHGITWVNAAGNDDSGIGKGFSTMQTAMAIMSSLMVS